MRRSSSRIAAVALFAITPIAALSLTASAAPADINFDCKGDAPIVGPQFFTFPQAAEVTAPETAAPGSAVDIVIDPAANTIPGEVNGFTVKEVKDFALKLPIPPNSTYVSADLTGGSGLGDTPPTITVDGDVATIAFPGPIAGGAEFELPTTTVHLTAGESGAIETKLSGTSHDDPGLTFTAVVNQLTDITVPTACFPNPNPVITTTTIG